MADTTRAAPRMSFNAGAITYRRGRPRYPDAVFDLLADRCGLQPGARVLEIGAGTGLATEPLLAAGAHMVAVEPGESLAADHACDRLEISVSDFEAADLPEGFDLALAATALHWLAPAAGIRAAVSACITLQARAMAGTCHSTRWPPIPAYRDSGKAALRCSPTTPRGNVSQSREVTSRSG